MASREYLKDILTTGGNLRVVAVEPSGTLSTIQSAVDYIEANLSPSHTNPAVVLVPPGVYDETVRIGMNGVGLVGLGGQGACRIRPASGPALVVSNATRGSLDAWLGGGVANYNANYGSLVNNGTGPWDNQFRDIDFAPQTSIDYAVVLAGVQGDAGAGKTSFGGIELNFMRCAMRNANGSLALWGRNTNYIAVQSGSWAQGTMRCYNCAGLWFNDSEGTNYNGVYYGVDPYGQPNDTGNYGLSGGKWVLRGNVSLEQEGRAGYDNLWGGVIEGNVSLQQTAAFRMRGGVIEGSVVVDGTASVLLEGVHVQGNLSFAAGAGTAQMDGGHYMGTLTDPGAKFVRNLGS